MPRPPLPGSLALVATLATGCLSAPTGIDPVDGAATPSWPPAGAEIRAIAAGDATGDGIDDLVAVDIGLQKVYLLRGGVDFATATSAIATSVSGAAPISGLRPPVAVTLAAGHIVVLDNPNSGPRVTVLDANLAITGTAAIGVPALGQNAAVSAHPSTFGMDGSSVFLTMPGQIVFIERNALATATPSVMRVMPPSGDTFDTAVIGDGYLAPGPQPRFFVAEPTKVLRADAAGGGALTWTTQRDAAAWIAQTEADLTGDGAPEIIGFDAQGSGAHICVAEIATGALPTCLAVPFMMDDMMSLTAADLMMPDRLDLAILHPQATMADVFVVPALKVEAGAVTGMMGGQPIMRTVPNALMAALQVESSGGRELMLVGSTGAMVCLRIQGNGAVDCTP